MKPQRNFDLHFPNGCRNKMNIFLYIHWPILLLLRTVQFIYPFIDWVIYGFDFGVLVL